MLKRPEWLGRSFNVRQAGRKNCLCTYSNLHNNGQSNPWKEWLRQSCMVWNCFGGTLLGYMCCTELQIRLMVGYMYVHTKSCIFIVRSTVMVHLAGFCASYIHNWCIAKTTAPLPAFWVLNTSIFGGWVLVCVWANECVAGCVRMCIFINECLLHVCT